MPVPVRGHEPRRLAEALQHVIDCRDWIVGPVLHVVRGPIGEAAGRVHAGEHGVFDVFAPITTVAGAELVHIRLIFSINPRVDFFHHDDIS